MCIKIALKKPQKLSCVFSSIFFKQKNEIDLKMHIDAYNFSHNIGYFRLQILRLIETERLYLFICVHQLLEQKKKGLCKGTSDSPIPNHSE